MAIPVPKIVDVDRHLGIKDTGDVTSTLPPYLRVAENVDIDDEAKIISRRGGYGSALIAGAYHSLWSNKARTAMYGVLSSQIYRIDPAVTPQTISIASLQSNHRVDFVEVGDWVFYANRTTIGGLNAAGASFTFGTPTFGMGASMPAGDLIEYHETCLYTALGGRIAPSLPMDVARTLPRSDWIYFPGMITMMKSVEDGIYVSYGSETAFMKGTNSEDFVTTVVADHAAIPYSAVKFDARLMSTPRLPLQGEAVYWASTAGPCVGFPGGKVLLLDNVDPLDGSAAATIVRENRKGYYQAVTILQN